VDEVPVNDGDVLKYTTVTDAQQCGALSTESHDCRIARRLPRQGNPNPLECWCWPRPTAAPSSEG
jgi:hypothetical protein